MDYFMKHQSNRDDYNYKEFIVDDATGIDTWPTDCAPGSIVFVVEGSRVFMLNNQKEWKEI